MKQRAIIRIASGVAAAAGAGVVLAVIGPFWREASDALVGEDEVDAEVVTPADAGLDGGSPDATAQTGLRDR